MSDQKLPKKSLGRGRGKFGRSEGPWIRSKKLDDESHELRPPKKDGEEFVLTESGFPPLPGATTADDQFEDKNEVAGTSQTNGTVTAENEPENQLTEVTPHTFPTIESPVEHYEKGQAEANKSEDLEKPKQDTTREAEPQDSKESEQNGNLENEKEVNLNKTENAESGLNGNSEMGKEIYLNEIVDVENSNLSPYAPEFVPQAVASCENTKNMNPEAEIYVPTSISNILKEANNNGVLTSYNTNDTMAILADLKETLDFCRTSLLEGPDLYDNLMSIVTPYIVKYIEVPDVPKFIVEKIYNDVQATEEGRFAYFGVKILLQLIKMSSTEDNCPLRDTLLRHTQEEVERFKNVCIVDPQGSTITSVQSFITFLSELYIQLLVGGRRLEMIGYELVETLKKVLVAAHIPLKERLKLITNMIKLTGLALDQDNPSYLDSLLSELAVMLEQERHNLDTPFYQYVNDIILLRSLRWGYVEPEYVEYVDCDNDLANGDNALPQQNCYDPTQDINMVYSSGVFYGPDGLPIDQGEHLFLEVETNAVNSLQLDDQGAPSPTSVEGFDEAYEEFLLTVPNQPPD